ncbi:hypothetical protein OSB04_007631 [Centaurea solstitialis]|uniref:Peptidase metallopeptidase domain-containing protein n=1 Tax=Centaurea solstitialis TaxID=347529 RepID=A0AA38TY13_9ASTR|nr:hypothetical protein OSB04_007631 [Centaurea solstitialis]
MGNIGNDAKLSSIDSIKQLKGCCEKGSKAQGLHQLKLYLSRFGYLNYQNTLDHGNTEDENFDNELEAALKSYQDYYRLNATGTLDGPTISQMVKPRCGLPDKKPYIHGSKSPRIVPHFKFFPPTFRWPASKAQYTYAFSPNYPAKHIPPVDRAFNQWAIGTHFFKFSKIPDFKHADLKISFEKRKHGDVDFDGPGLTLAHAFAPTDGRLHFDIEESWSDGPKTDYMSFDLESAAVHEIGHLFGLDHSDDPNAIMFATMDPGVKKGLNADDIKGIKRIRERLRTAQSRQKSYADRRRSDLEFQVGDRVLLKVSPWKGVIRFRKRGKLGPRYIGPFTVLARVGKVAYRLELPAVLGQIHSTFHVSQLRKCLADETAHIPLDDIQVDESLNYVERPVAVIDRKVKRLRRREIGIVKVQWQHRKGSEWTWEPEAEMREHYPELFSD